MNPLCQCPEPGVCTRHGVTKNVREHKLCLGVDCTAETCVKYWNAWENGKQRGQTVPVPEPKLLKPNQIKTLNSNGSIPQPTTSVGCKSCGGGNKVAPTAAKLEFGPGSDLMYAYGKMGIPHCQACIDMKYKMNAWGPDGCDEHLHEIVADMFPRAKAWQAENHPWIHKWTPTWIEDAAIQSRLLSDVKAAIASSREKLARRDRALNRQPNKSKPVGKPLDRDKVVSHILYHIMPLAGPAEWIWRRHVEWLREVRPQFNGRLIIGIVTKAPRDSWEYCDVETVKAAFEGMDAEFVVAQNENADGRGRGRGEGLTFPLMLEMIQTTDPNEVFFYGHAKAVTHPDQPLGAPFHLWTAALFDASFRNRAAMLDALDYYGIAGSFKVPKAANTHHNWHYSGTFWACRSIDVFRRDWRFLKTYYGCVEMWVNWMFDDSQAACLFLDGIPNSQLLYTPEYWRDTVTPAWETWKAEQRVIHPPVTLATVVFNPSVACIANLNRILSDAKRILGPSTQTIVIDNSPARAAGIVADIHHWNEGVNKFWGGGINIAVQLATGEHMIHFSSQRSRVRDHRWMKALLAPLANPNCGMAGPVQAVRFHLIGEQNPRPGQPEVHIQQSVFAARVKTLKKFPWGETYIHTYSDVWQSWSMIAGGLNLVNVPEVTSAAGLEKCKPGAFLECVAEKL